MTIYLAPWLLVPGLLTAVLVLGLVHEALSGDLGWRDVALFFSVWSVLMAVSLASIWSAK